MRNMKRVFMALLALVILVGGVGASAQPAQAAGCAFYHTVRYGETLSWIGRYYGVSWPYLAQVNGIHNPRWIYAGQRLCIPGGWGQQGNTGGQPENRSWTFQVNAVDPNVSFTIQGFSLPSNVRINVRLGVPDGNHFNFKDLGDLDTSSGGTQTYVVPIPAEYNGAGQLKLRLSQVKKNGKIFQQDIVFYNTYSGPSGGVVPPGWNYPPYYYYGIPTIWIVGVQRNSSVTIQTNNFPAGVTFDVRMGPMGTAGVGGWHVGTLNSGGGGTQNATFSIPPQLYNHYQIAIRTENYWTGYYSYNWFYNNSTY